MGGLAVATSVSLIAGNTTANISLVVTLPRAPAARAVASPSAHIVMNKRAHQLQLPVQLVHDAVYS